LRSSSARASASSSGGTAQQAFCVSETEELSAAPEAFANHYRGEWIKRMFGEQCFDLAGSMEGSCSLLRVLASQDLDLAVRK